MNGQYVIKDFCNKLPEKPGIYKMIGDGDELLYIGKAKNLKNRVTYYTKPDLPTRLAKMVFFTIRTEYIITKTESEAFLLEASQIKLHQPRFNILLKDDKSFPFIRITINNDYPQILKYRGKKIKDEGLFGPFASSSDVDSTINNLRKIFKLRSCTDSYFEQRKRPCLQYQIKKCSAPCTGKISQAEYQQNVKYAVDFLSGKNSDLQKEFADKMQNYSKNMQYEKAAETRDNIRALSYVQINSSSISGNIIDADVIAITMRNDIYCVAVFFYRNGQNYGAKSYFPKQAEGSGAEEVLASFIGQFYQTRIPPDYIISNVNLEDKEAIEEALSNLHGAKTKFIKPTSGDKKELINHVLKNAEESLNNYINEKVKSHEILQDIMTVFDLEEEPTRIEIYDNSHIMGKFAVGAMVVVGRDGFEKSEYRKFTIETNNNDFGGDDYQMLREVLTRRVKRLKDDPSKTPSLIIIDGGKAHLNVAAKVFADMNFHVNFAAMSKGEKRNAGGETFHLIGKEPFTLSNRSNVMKYLQVLRDEAHNYAIKSHRQKRSKAISVSEIDAIPLVGPLRKKLLLNYFGSFESIKNATIEDLQKVDGISIVTAKKIYNYFR